MAHCGFSKFERRNKHDIAYSHLQGEAESRAGTAAILFAALFLDSVHTGALPRRRIGRLGYSTNSIQSIAQNILYTYVPPQAGLPFMTEQPQKAETNHRTNNKPK